MKFSIRTLLFLTLVISIAFTGLTKRDRSTKTAKNLIKSLNGTFWFDKEKLRGFTWDIAPRIALQPSKIASQDSLREKMLNYFFGEDRTKVIRAIKIQPNDTNVSKVKTLLSQSIGLAGVEIVTITGPADGALLARHLYPIDQLQNIRFLRIGNAQLDRNFFLALSKVEDLEFVDLVNCNYEIEDLEPLSESIHLAWVKLGRTDFEKPRLQQVRSKVPATYLTPLVKLAED